MDKKRKTLGFPRTLNWTIGRGQEQNGMILGTNLQVLFYKCAKARQGKNEIRAIKNKEGVWIVDPLAIKDEFVNYYTDLFSNNVR